MAKALQAAEKVGDFLDAILPQYLILRGWCDLTPPPPLTSRFDTDWPFVLNAKSGGIGGQQQCPAQMGPFLPLFVVPCRRILFIPILSFPCRLATLDPWLALECFLTTWLS